INIPVGIRFKQAFTVYSDPHRSNSFALTVFVSPYGIQCFRRYFSAVSGLITYIGTNKQGIASKYIHADRVDRGGSIFRGFSNNSAYILLGREGCMIISRWKSPISNATVITAGVDIAVLSVQRSKANVAAVVVVLGP